MPICQVVTLSAIGKHMCEGEFESLKAIHAVSPGFVPEPYAWGKYSQEDTETYFLLAEFRDVGEQVRASRFVVFRYTHGIKVLASFPAAHRYPVDTQKRYICLSFRWSSSFFVSYHCLEANH